MSSRTVAVAAVLLAVGASGCAAPGSAPATHTSASNNPSGQRAAATGSPSPMLVPTAPAGTPLGAGERVWAAFSDRGLPRAGWWAQLRPLLSDSARAVYVYDDPRRIPSMRITGKVHVAPKAPGEPKYTAEVVVPTSVGEFDLDLERHTLRSGWLLYAIKFPPGVE